MIFFLWEVNFIFLQLSVIVWLLQLGYHENTILQSMCKFRGIGIIQMFSYNNYFICVIIIVLLSVKIIQQNENIPVVLTTN